MNWKIFCTLIIFALALSGKSVAGNQASQAVTLRIEPIAVVVLAGTGSNRVKLFVDEHGTTTESLELLWVTNLEGMKVQVVSDLPANMQGYILKVRVTSLVSRGNSTGWVAIDEVSREIITGISRETGKCLLEYQVLPKLNSHPDTHVLIYTITHQ